MAFKIRRNIGVFDRIIRFVIFDLLIAFSMSDFIENPLLANANTILMLLLLASIIIGFSPIYALLNFTTVELKTET
jgi:hypothetical protein